MSHYCKNCGGTGKATCPRCGGTGTFNDGSTCYYCNGKGYYECNACNGTGKIEDYTEGVFHMGSCEKCADCLHCRNGYCDVYDKTVNPNSRACPEFEEN